jgi:hypothetical protein
MDASPSLQRCVNGYQDWPGPNGLLGDFPRLLRARSSIGSAPVGYAELVEGVIEQLELPDLEDPLAYLHGSYRSVGDLPGHG